MAIKLFKLVRATHEINSISRNTERAVIRALELLDKNIDLIFQKISVQISNTLGFPLLAPFGDSLHPSYSFGIYTVGGIWLDGSTNPPGLEINAPDQSNRVRGVLLKSTSWSIGAFDSPSSLTPGLCTLGGYDALGSNKAGSSLLIRTGKPTGNAAATTITLQTSIVGSSGTTQQTLTDRLILDSTGAQVPAGQWLRVPSERSRVTVQFDKTDVTLANITGLSINVLAGRTYKFRAVLFVDADAAGGHKYAIAGTATATAIIYQINSLDNTALAHKIASRQTALGGNAGENSGTVYKTEIEGLITVNAAGTLTVQFAQNVATGTSSVLVGSYFTVEDMGS